MTQRVWCAEQALRLGAGGVIVIDGDHFDTLAWRRLHLAAQSASQAASCTDDDSPGAVNGTGAPGPVVLVLTSPHASGGLRPRGCAAETRWTVHPSFDIASIHEAWPHVPLGRVGMAGNGGSSGGSIGGRSVRVRAPAWSVRLVSARSLDSAVSACGVSRAVKRAWIEQARLECLVHSREAVGSLHPPYRITSAAAYASTGVLQECGQAAFMQNFPAFDETESIEQCIASQGLRSVHSAHAALSALSA
jgi:hypothetical protein